MPQEKNVFINGAKNVSVFLTNLFPLEGKYNIVVANLPYTDYEAKDFVESSVWDKNHDVLIAFLKNVGRFLDLNGRVYLSWAEFADFTFLESLIVKNDFCFEVVNTLAPYRVYLIKKKQPAHF